MKQQDLPGSDAEHNLQKEFETRDRALEFYENQVYSSLTDRMKEFIQERIMFFLATADETGDTDCSPRFGPRGFVNILDDDHICYPEYRGNGVQASLGNIEENPHATLLFIDWWETTVGFHINGQAELCESLPTATDPVDNDKQKTWVKVEVDEAYIHCAKHVPRLKIEEANQPWGTDDLKAKKAGYFIDGAESDD